MLPPLALTFFRPWPTLAASLFFPHQTKCKQNRKRPLSATGWKGRSMPGAQRRSNLTSWTVDCFATPEV